MNECELFIVRLPSSSSSSSSSSDQQFRLRRISWLCLPARCLRAATLLSHHHPSFVNAAQLRASACARSAGLLQTSVTRLGGGVGRHRAGRSAAVALGRALAHGGPAGTGTGSGTGPGADGGRAAGARVQDGLESAAPLLLLQCALILQALRGFGDALRNQSCALQWR